MIAASANAPLTVVGAYARFSNDALQRDASVDDQFRTCSEAAEEKGWVIDSALLFSDSGLSGATMSTREGIQALLKRIESDRTKNYHGFMFDDSSRLGRNLAEVLQFCKVCEFHGVFLYFVNQQLDSRDPHFYQLIINYASSDENFLKSLRHGVIRGQIGRINQGMTHGGKYYGFKGEAIPDLTKRSTASRMAIKGVKLIIDEVDAPAIRAIYDMADQGLSCLKIALACRKANFPRPERKNGARIWTRENVTRILHNPMYCGYLSYGKTSSAKHPITGRIENRPVAESKWTVKHFPELAIVSVEQWERVQDIIKSHNIFGVSKLGGMARRDPTAPAPLFTGLLVCADCQGSFVVTDRDKAGDRILQCRHYRFHKTCHNSVKVLESVLERHLIDHIVGKILTSESLDYAIEQFHTQLTARLHLQQEHLRKGRSSAPALAREQSRLESERRNIMDALRELGPVESLKEEFVRIEDRLRMIADGLKQDAAQVPQEVSLNDAQQFVHDQAKHLSELLLSDRVSAQLALRRCIGKLTISRASSGRMPMCRVQGEVQVCQ